MKKFLTLGIAILSCVILTAINTPVFAFAPPKTNKNKTKSEL